MRKTLQVIALSLPLILANCQREYVPIVSLKDIHALHVEGSEVYLGVFDDKGKLNKIAKYKIVGLDGQNDILYFEFEGEQK